MSAVNWFNRSCGKWASKGQYLYAPRMKPVIIDKSFELIALRNNRFRCDWGAGQMDLLLNGVLLHGSRNCLTEQAFDAQVSMIDNDCLVMSTRYDGTRFREEIRLLEDDFYRLRSTVGYNLRTGQLVLSGQFLEYRI